MVISTHLPPPVMIDSTAVLEAVTHILCCSCGMCFSAAPSSENDQGSMEFGLENRARTLHNAVQRRRHPPLHRVENPPLDLCDGLSGVTLIPAAVEILGDGAELDNKVTRQVLR